MERARFPVAAHVFFRRRGAVLLLRRHGTGFFDGSYGLPSGHLEGGEPVAAAARECREEVGVKVAPADLRPVGVVHYTSPEGEGVDFFFVATRWAGEPTPCAECDEVRWCALDALPPDTIPFVRRAIARHLGAGEWFDQDGWA